jgi:hypothetical protein
MKVLWFLTLLFFLYWLFGLTTAILLQRATPINLYRVPAIRLTLPILGFAALNTLWWAGVHRWAVPPAVVLLIAGASTAVALTLVATRRITRRAVVTLLPSRCDWPVLLVILCVCVSVAWTYVWAGFGNFFLVNDTDFFSRTILAVVGTSAPVGELAADLAMLQRQFPFQLSSLTLTQSVLNISATDAACLQAVFHTLSTSLGVYWLSRYIFRVGRAVCFAASLGSILGQFYFHTYLDGHLGSLLYVAMAPVLIGIVIVAVVHGRYATTIPAGVLVWFSMTKAYPMVVFLLLPAVVLTVCVLALRRRWDELRGRVVKLAARWRFSWRVASALMFALVLAVSVAGYAILRAVTLPNRLSLIFNGYQPMSIIFDWQAIPYFFGLRIVRGFGYGFIEPSQGTGMRLFEVAAAVVCALLMVAACDGAWRSRKSPRRLFLAMFVAFFPATVIGFALVWPFSYLLYKALYVHYFLIVIAITLGVASLLRRVRRWWWPCRPAVYGCVVAIVAVNVYGDVRNSAIALRDVRELEIADARQLADRIRQLGLQTVALTAGRELSWGIITQALREAGIQAQTHSRPGFPLITAQRRSLAPIPDGEIAVSSPNGKYVVSYTPTSHVQVVTLGTTTEVRHGVAFRWLASQFDYNSLLVLRQLDDFVNYWRSLPATPCVVNDVPDSGYYLLINEALAKSGVASSRDPGACEYFLRFNRSAEAVEDRLRENPSPVVAPISLKAGRARVGGQTYVASPAQRRVWSNDLFEAVYLPRQDRVVAPVPGLDVDGLLAAARQGNWTVSVGVGEGEHERWYLQSRLADAGLLSDGTSIKPAAVLVCVPNFMLEELRSSDTEFGRSVLWHTPQTFADAEGYQIILLPPGPAAFVRTRYLAGEWDGRRPLRTLLWPVKAIRTRPELSVRTFLRQGEIRLYMETGPSLDGTTVELRAMRLDGRRRPLSFTLSAPSGILSIPIEELAIPGDDALDLVLEANVQVLKRVMPYDDRLLALKLLRCEVVVNGEPLYTDAMRSVLAADADGADVLDGRMYPGALLGTGWHARERENGSVFRWMGQTAEIVINDGESSPAMVKIAGLVGPSAQKGRVTFSVSLNGHAVGVIAGSTSPGGKSELVLDCRTPQFHKAWRSGQNILRFTLNGATNVVPGDPRLLAFRAFRIALSR